MRSISRWCATALALGVAIALAVPGANAATTSGTTSIRGTVYGAGGAPLAKAKVTAYALPGLRAGCMVSPDEWRAIASATSGKTGAYAITGLATGSYRIGVVPADLTRHSFGYRLASSYPDDSADHTANVTSWIGYADDVTAPGPAVDIYAALPAAISGRITDQDTSAGIPGIEVRAVTTGQWQRIYPMAVTDATGRYTIAGFPLGAPDPVPGAPNEAQRYGPVLVDPNGWYGVWLWWFDDLDNGTDHTVDLTQGTTPFTYDHTMLRGGRLTVQVADPSGRAVPGLAVTLDSAFPWPTQFTNAKGKAFLGTGTGYDIAYNAVRVQDFLGRYRTTWSGNAPTWSQAQKVPVLPGLENFVKITVRPDAATLISTANFWSGDPLRNVLPEEPALVMALMPGATFQDWDQSIGESMVYCDGSIELHGLWPGMATDVRIGGYEGDGVATSTVTLASGVNHVGTQRLPSWIVRVQVYDEDDDPVPGASVELRDADDPEAPVSWPTASATTDENGDARVWVGFWPNLTRWPQDPLRLYVAADGFDDGYYLEPEGLTGDPWSATSVLDQNGFDRDPFDVSVRLTPSPPPA